MEYERPQHKSRLTFIKEVRRKIKGTRGFKTHVRGLYLCECGKLVEIKQSYVKFGNRKTCGCDIGTVRKGAYSHGLRKHPLYKRLADIKDRCSNPNSPAYKYYGGRGVKICDEWLTDFKSFYDWAIANGWEKGKEIDKDKKAKEAGVEALEYSPQWCSVIDKSENNKYRRSSIFITLDGETKCVKDWAKKYGISRSTITNRIKEGWNNEDAVKKPLIKPRINK